MNPFLSVFFLAGIPILFLLQRHKTLFVLSLISVVSDLFRISTFGTNLYIFNYIALFYSIYFFQDVFKPPASSGWFFLKYLFAEYFLLIIGAIVFGVLFPWEDPFSDRSWNQRISNRAAIALVKSFSDIMVCYYFHYLFKKQLVSGPFLFNALGIITVINIVIAISDFFTGYAIKFSLFSVEIRNEILSRFTGLEGEPRVLGRNSGLTFLMFYCFSLNKVIFSKWQNLYLIVSILGLILSISVSAAVTTTLVFGVLLLFHWKPRHLLTVALFTIIATVSYQIISKNEYYQFLMELRLGRLEQGNEYDQMVGEPLIFTKFEVFDRAALNFFYNNPKHLLLGAGPNLINFPAGNYISNFELTLYAGHLDNPPFTGILFILSRSGILGLFIYGLLFLHLFQLARLKGSRLCSDFLWLILVFCNIIFMPFYMLLAIYWGVYYYSSNQNNA
ncbi:MAG: hypothetical protein U0Y10_03395 [Spirosomataceae bacterium]